MTPTSARVVVTLGAPFVVWLVAGSSAPVDFPYRSYVSGEVAGVGLAPVVTAFLLVELFAAVMPPWRALRVSGPVGRATLTRAAWKLAAALMAWELVVLVMWHGGSLISWSSSLVVMLVLNVGWTLTLVFIARMVSRMGLVNGYALLLAFEWVPSRFLFESPYGMLVASMALLGLAALTAVVVESRQATQTHGDLTLRAPLSGVTPLVATMTVMGLPQGRWATVWEALPLDGLRELYLGTPEGIVLSMVLVIVFAYVFAQLFNRRVLLLSWVPDDAGLAVRQGFRRALSHTLVFTLCLTVGTQLLESTAYLPLFAATPAAACFAALLLDARDELRARAKLGQLVPVWSEQRTYALGALSAALASAGIPHHVRSVRLRTLLPHVPLVPAELLVAPAHVGAATDVLAARNAHSVATVQGHTPTTF